MGAYLGKGQEQLEGHIRGNRIVVNKTVAKEGKFGTEGPGKALDLENVQKLGGRERRSDMTDPGFKENVKKKKENVNGGYMGKNGVGRTEQKDNI